MRRILAQSLLAAVLVTGTASFAEESSAPITVADNSTSDAPTASSGGSALRASGALLDKSEFNRPMMLSFFVNLPWGYWWGGFGFGASARFAIPIVKNGFLPMLNDSFWIEFGADTYFLFPIYGFAFGLTIPAEVMWMFHLIPKLAVYAKLGVGVTFYFGDYGLGARVWPYFYASGALGVVYNITDKLALRGEVGTHSLKAGIAICF